MDAPRAAFSPCQSCSTSSDCVGPIRHSRMPTEINDKNWGKQMGKRAISAAACSLAAVFLIGPGLAQEVKQDTKSASNQAKISSVTQDQLNAADKNASNF